MKSIKKATAVILAAIFTIGCAFIFSSCTSSSFQLADSDIIKEQGKISSTPYFAEYNSDGTFTFRIAVYNGTKYTKLLTSVNIQTLQDEKGRDIVDECDFTVDEVKYIEPGKVDIIQFDYEKDQVLINTGLNKLTSKVSLNYYGCVRNGDEPEKTNTDGYTASVIEATVSDTGALDGKIMIRNNFKSDKTPQSISFDIYTDAGTKINLNTIVKSIDQPIKSGATLSLGLGVAASDVDVDFATKREFDTLIIKNLKID